MERSLLSIPIENKPEGLGINFVQISDRLHKVMKKKGKPHTLMDGVNLDKRNELLGYFFEEISKHASYFNVYFEISTVNKIRVIFHDPVKYEKKTRKFVEDMQKLAKKRMHNTLIIDETNDWADALCIQRNHNLVFSQRKPFSVDKKRYSGSDNFYYIVHCKADSI